jgi:hypothetical protein
VARARRRWSLANGSTANCGGDGSAPGFHAPNSASIRGHSLRRIEVPREHQRHVAGHVVALEVRPHRPQRRPLEVRDLAEDVVAAIRVPRERPAHEPAKQLISGDVHRAVLLLVDRLELGREQAKHRLPEALGVQRQPGVDLAGRESVVIDGLVVAGERIDPAAAELAQQLIELVRHRVGVGLLDDRRDLAIDRRLLARGAVRLRSYSASSRSCSGASAAQSVVPSRLVPLKSICSR